LGTIIEFFPDKTGISV